MSNPENPSAFPIPNATDMDGYVFAPTAQGMSLRDWFAGQALREFVGQYRLKKEAAEAAYQIADAMLAERLK